MHWGRRYIDDAIGRRVDRDPTDGWSLDQEVFYSLTDALFSVRAVTTSNGTVRERIDYTPYGEAMHRYAIDLNEDGVYDAADTDAFDDTQASSGPGDPDYDPDADFDGDGLDTVGSEDDQYFFDGLWTLYASDPVLPAGWVSDPGDDAGPDSMISFAGGWHAHACVSMFGQGGGEPRHRRGGWHAHAPRGHGRAGFEVLGLTHRVLTSLHHSSLPPLPGSQPSDTRNPSPESRLHAKPPARARHSRHPPPPKTDPAIHPHPPLTAPAIAGAAVVGVWGGWGWRVVGR